jgi:hypothetical protein
VQVQVQTGPPRAERRTRTTVCSIPRRRRRRRRRILRRKRRRRDGTLWRTGMPPA